MTDAMDAMDTTDAPGGQDRSELFAQLEPLVLRSELHATLWGGRHLAAVAGKSLPEGAAIGEAWETAVACVVHGGPHAGATLGDLVARYGASLTGTRAHELAGPQFPLLAKFLDARQPLSIQVHPDDAYAARHEQGKLGKTEAWYILHAEPGAQLVWGWEQETTRDAIAQAIAQTRLEPLLHYVDAHAGDVLFVPAGTVHAIGAGIVLYELQEYSDVTYRLYDYGRLQANGQPRALHIEQSLEVLHLGRAVVDRATPVDVTWAASPEPSGTPGTTETRESDTSRTTQGSRRILVGCRYFVLEELSDFGTVSARTEASSCHILTLLEGACVLRTAVTEHVLGRGDTVVVPASLGPYTLSGDQARLLRSYVPEDGDPHLALWRRAQPESFGE